MARTTGPDGVEIELATEPSPIKTFTAADLERAREEEKNKLYGRLQTFEKSAEEAKAMAASLQEQVSQLTSTQAERDAQAAADAAAAAEAKRLLDEAEMDAKSQILSVEERFKQQMADRDKAWEAQMQAVTEQSRTQAEIIAKERQLNARQAYITQRQQEEADNVIPDLWDLVQGETPEQIEVSIATLRDKSAAILAATQDVAAQQQPILFPGARVTAPSADNPLAHQTATLTSQQIKDMSMTEYQKYRDQLLRVRPQTGPSPY